MAKICCLCGKKIGVFEVENTYTQNQTEIIACEKCATHINFLIEISNGIPIKKEYIEEAKSYISKILQENQNLLSSENKTFFINLLSEADKGIKNVQENEEKKINQQKEKEHRINSLMATTGYDFQGYKIIKYIDIISCEYVLGTGFFSEFSASFSDTFGTSSNAFSNKIATAKRKVLKRMKSETVEVRGNALIGIDFDILTFNNNMIAVSGNGTAVCVEPIK